MRSILIFCIIHLFYLSHTLAFSQQGNNWYFGHNAAITFNTTPPSFISTSSMQADEACSSVSDRNGNLLFYTDGITVYNKLNVPMPNGNGLMGNLSATTTLIVQQPGSQNIFFVFTTDAGLLNNAKGYRYSIVDMALNGGLGDVTAAKNIQFVSTPSTERFAAVKHSNRTDIWIIIKEYGNNRYDSYLLTCSGLNTTPVSTDIGVIHGDPTELTAQGQMKVSPDGKKLGVAINVLNIAELFDFNTTTGLLTNVIDLTVFPYDIAGVYGAEFSPDNKLFYVSHRIAGTIYQFDISSNNQASINASVVQIPVIGYPIGLQTGPDGKIYISNFGQHYVGVISNPNSYSSGYGFNQNEVFLQSALCNAGLPAFVSNYYQPPAWTANFTSSFVNCSIDFSGTASITGPVQWNWDFGDGVTANGQNVRHSYRAAGTYTVTLKVFSITTCGTITDSVVVAHPITVSNVLSVDFSQFGSCVNTAYQFNNNIVLTAGSITGYAWDFGDGGTAVSPNPAYIYSGPGAYDVKLVVSTSGICRADSILKRVFVDSKPLASFRAQDGCINQPISFTDQSSNTTGPVSLWNWDFGGSGSSNLPSPLYTFLTSGNYPVRLTVTSLHGCSDDTLKTISIEDKPVARFTENAFCLNQPVNFINQSSVSFGNINQWNWNFGDGNISTQQNPSHLFISEGDYPVTLTVTTVNGCLSDPISTIGQVRKVIANAGPDTIALYSQPFQLHGSGGATFQWSPGIYLNNPTIANPVATLSEDQIFTLTVITSQGCIGSDGVKITVVKYFDVFVPTGFTPNKDGKNDYLMPYTFGIKEINRFEVYNRWGQRVFSTTLTDRGWDGTINGVTQDGGVYIWVVKATTIKNQVIEKKGTCLLIR